jgi:hypothetical protein
MHTKVYRFNGIGYSRSAGKSEYDTPVGLHNFKSHTEKNCRANGSASLNTTNHGLLKKIASVPELALEHPMYGL